MPDENKPPPSPGHPSTMDDALKLFVLGQRISIKPLDSNRPRVSFTVCNLSTPVTKSIVVLAKPDVGDPAPVVIKIFDPRYLDERISTIRSSRSYPWNLSNGRAAATARSENSALSDDRLVDMTYSNEPEDLSRDDLATHYLLWEERFYRLPMESYNSEHKSYDRLKDLQGSAIPRLILAGQFISPDERAIQPPALVLEYMPSVSLRDVPSDAITPAICTQLLSAVESFPSHGVIYNDVTLTNVRFTPPEQPVLAFAIDFGCAVIWGEDDDKEYWREHADSDRDYVSRDRVSCYVLRYGLLYHESTIWKIVRGSSVVQHPWRLLHDTNLK